MEEKKFDQSAMLEWCDTELVKGINAFREVKAMGLAIGMVDEEEFTNAEYFSLGFASAFGFAARMFESGEASSNLEVSLRLVSSFAYSKEKLEKKDED